MLVLTQNELHNLHSPPTSAFPCSELLPPFL